MMVVRGVVVDSLDSRPLPGAVISLVTDWGVTNSTADKDGAFQISCVRLDNETVKFEVAMLGYRIYRAFLPDGMKLELGKIRMAPDVQQIDAVTVTARMKMFEQRGDTILFFPASVRLPEGSSTLDLLKKMPGVEASDEEVKVGGERVERSYVNGREVFGKDPMNALHYLEADKVSLIKAYDEADGQSAMQYGEQNARKRRVLNIVTFDLMNQSLQAGVAGSYGADFDKGPEGQRHSRYLLAGGVRFFSEKRQLLADYTSYNTGRLIAPFTGSLTRNGGDATYYQNNSFTLNYSHKAGLWNFAGKYGYGRSRDRLQSASWSDYFPTDRYSSKSYEDASADASVGKRHSGEVSVENYARKDIALLKFSVVADDGCNTDRIRSATQEEGVPVASRLIRNTDRAKRLDLDFEGSWTHAFSSGSLSVSIRITRGNGDADGWRRDSSLLMPGSRELVVLGTTRGTTARADAAYSFNFREAGTLTAGYGYEYAHNRVVQDAFDKGTGASDPALIQDYTNHYATQSGSLQYQLKAEPFYVTAGLVCQDKRFVRDDPFVPQSGGDPRFGAVLPSVNFVFSKSIGKRLEISYTTAANAPAQQMLMNKLDNRNPLWLQAGNPHLKQSYVHNIEVRWWRSSTETQSRFSASFRGSWSRNGIVARQTYFAAGQYLPDYDYEAPAGSFLSTYANAGGTRSLMGYAGYSRAVGWLKSTVDASVSYAYSRNPAYVSEVLAYAVDRRPGFQLRFKSNFSDKLDISLDSYTDFSFVRTSEGNSDRAFIESIRCDAEYDVGKRVFVNMRYLMKCHYSFDYRESRQTEHLMDWTLGYRLFRKRRGEISFSACNIFNRNKVLESVVNVDNLTNKWRYQMGRFFTFNFLYKFTRTK